MGVPAPSSGCLIYLVQKQRWRIVSCFLSSSQFHHMAVVPLRRLSERENSASKGVVDAICEGQSPWSVVVCWRAWFQRFMVVARTFNRCIIGGRVMGIQPPEKTILDWRRAYRLCHGEAAPRVDYSKGWFRVSGGCGVREADVLRWTELLRREATQRGKSNCSISTGSNINHSLIGARCASGKSQNGMSITAQ